VVFHLLGFFERAAVLQIRRDAGRAEAMIAELGGDVGGSSAPADHRVGVRLGQGCAGEQPALAAAMLIVTSQRRDGRVPLAKALFSRLHLA